MPKVVEIEYDGFRALNLSNPFLSLTVIPSLGGKIVSLYNKRSGFDFAFKNSHIDNHICEYDSDYAESSASGIDECFPTIALSQYEEQPWKGIKIPDHGEVWCQEVDTELKDNTIIQKIHGVRFPYCFNRTINLEENRVILNYRVENLSSFDLNYIWSIHPHFDLYENTKISIKGNPDVYVDFTKNNSFKLKTKKYKWPVLKTEDGKEIDFSLITDIENGDAEKLYLQNMIDGEIVLEYLDQNESITFRFDENILKYCGIWIDKNGWPFDTDPYKVLAIEPCSCISDRLEDSIQRGSFETVKAKNYDEWKLELIISRN